MTKRTIRLAVAFCVAAAPAFAQEGDAARGEELYVDCAACHALEEGVHGLGPSLYGMFGRRAGEIPEFHYSPAMTNSGITWTADTLNAFIANPQAAVPLNRMPYSGMTDAQDRADLIAYLRNVLQ